MRSGPSCRADVVLELFAHDREALAWVLAEAEGDLVAEIHGLARSPASSRWSARSRLAMAAVSALEGAQQGPTLARSRSPVLEMPATLSYRAHRTDTRDAVVELLKRVRQTRAGWGWLIVETFRLSPPTDLLYYVQFSSYPGPDIRAEAIGVTHMPEGSRLDGEQRARMIELGWREGTMEESTGNWLQPVHANSATARAAVAELALSTLETLSRSDPLVRFREAINVWTPDSV